MNSQTSINSAISSTQTPIKVFKYRWVVLTIFILVCIVNFMQMLQFSIISNIITKYYHVQDFLVDITSLVFYISYIIFFYPVSYFIEKHSLKFTMITATSLTLAGNLLKLLAAKPDRFWIVLVAQTLIAVGQIYFCSIPSKIATTWFGAEEVSTACAIGVLGMQLGSALGCIQSPYMVKNESSEKIENQLFDMFLYQAIASTAVYALVLGLFRSKPSIPPSQSQLSLITNEEVITKTFFKNMKEIVHEKNFWLVVFSLGLANGMWNSFGVLLNSVYLNYFPNGENDAGLLALISIIVGGCIGSMIFGVVLDKTHQFKKISVFLLVCCLLSYIGVAFSLIEKSRIGSFIVIPIFGFFLAPVLIVGYEYLVEITYPIPEACSASAFNASFCLLTCIATLLLEGLYGWIGYTWTSLVTFCIILICVISSVFIKTDLKRRDANLQQPEVGCSNVRVDNVMNTNVSIASF